MFHVKHFRGVIVKVEKVNEIFKNMPISIIVAYLLIIILIILCLFLLKSNFELEKKYRKFMRGINTKNLETLVVDYLDKIDGVGDNINNIKNDIEQIDNYLKKCVQKTAVIRYKAFDNVGSDLSYSIAFLDRDDNGVILTGLYGRNQSTAYAKPIDKGISRYDLSKEEIEVLNKAVNKKQ